VIQVYTGDGKGKTTAALGLILRNLGAGQRPCLIQFLKKDDYSEILWLKGQIDLFQYGSGEWVDPNHLTGADISAAQQGLAQAETILRENRHDLVVLDEINVAVAWKLLPVEAVLAVINIPTRAELVLTGRSADPRILERADLVTEMREIKHYYRQGIAARPGIEF
jgi:cob(I)alamin adenosyltransferase